MALVAYGLAVSGDKEAARQLLEGLTAIDKPQSVDATRIAFIHVALGEKDLACGCLEKAYAARSGFLVWLKVDPIFDSLRSEPRFMALLKKMHFP